MAEQSDADSQEGQTNPDAANTQHRSLYYLRLRHARHYINTIAEVDLEFLAGGDGFSTALTVFDRERDQLDAARDWLNIYEGDPEVDMLLIADATATLQIGNLRYTNQAELLQLQRALRIAQRRGDSGTQARFLNSLGVVYDSLGDTNQAIDLYQQALKIVRKLSNRRSEGKILINLGSAYTSLGNIHYAIQLHQQSLALARETADRHGECSAFSNLGFDYVALGDARQAIHFYQQALTLMREFGDRKSEGNMLSSIGRAYTALGDANYAIHFHRQHLALARNIGDRIGEGVALNNLGLVYTNLGDTQQAILLYQQRLVIAHDTGDIIAEKNTFVNLGNAYRLLGDKYQAIEFHKRALAIIQRIGHRPSEGHSLSNLGMAYFDLGDVQQAIDCFQQHLDIIRETGNRNDEGITLGNLGAAYAAQGDVYRCNRCFQQALFITREIGARQREADVSWNYGVALVRQGELDQALILMEASQAFHKQISHPLAAIMANVVAYVRAFRTLPDQKAANPVFDNLPKTVRDALVREDDSALETALAALPNEERIQVTSFLQEINQRIAQEANDCPTHTDTSPADTRADIDDTIQRLLPLLGDIVLATHGNETARQLAEASLPVMEQGGWPIAKVTRRIWEGERDETTLTEGLDELDRAVVHRILLLLTSNPDMIAAAGTLQIERLRYDADRVFTYTYANGDAKDRARLVRQFETLARETEQQVGAPWRALAAHLCDLAAQLRAS